ncbi:hypothetical protein EXIGLDRAFT_699728 [Exidia glandulosa HHB12029]|uniref:Uncharacterized protein n=1 Tax=Exidia glandulosa HHB12029 TaxID=1314781 RepID=A0A165DR53_EXIGL|nr:hypothetical protein EXIGLDRAFT_699728 [Exidia glandulosa HHB12029]
MGGHARGSFTMPLGRIHIELISNAAGVVVTLDDVNKHSSASWVFCSGQAFLEGFSKVCLVTDPQIFSHDARTSDSRIVGTNYIIVSVVGKSAYGVVTRPTHYPPDHATRPPLPSTRRPLCTTATDFGLRDMSGNFSHPAAARVPRASYAMEQPSPSLTPAGRAKSNLTRNVTPKKGMGDMSAGASVQFTTNNAAAATDVDMEEPSAPTLPTANEEDTAIHECEQKGSAGAADLFAGNDGAAAADKDVEMEQPSASTQPSAVDPEDGDDAASHGGADERSAAPPDPSAAYDGTAATDVEMEEPAPSAKPTTDDHEDEWFDVDFDDDAGRAEDDVDMDYDADMDDTGYEGDADMGYGGDADMDHEGDDVDLNGVGNKPMHTESQTAGQRRANAPATTNTLKTLNHLVAIMEETLESMPTSTNDSTVASWARSHIHELRGLLNIARTSTRAESGRRPSIPDLTRVVHGLKANMAKFRSEMASFHGLRRAARPSEVQDFDADRGDGPTAGDFRVDMDPQRRRSSSWNVSAAEIFASSFCSRHTSWTRDEVKKAFFVHLRSVQDQQLLSIAGPAPKDVQKKRHVRAIHRQWTLFQQRLTVAHSFKGLDHLIPLLDGLGAHGMSPDVSDDEDRSGPTKYRRKPVPWRSPALTSLLHDLDTLYLHLRFGNGKKTNGNRPRFRTKVDQTLGPATSRPVKRLPIDCYSQPWYKSLDKVDAASIRAMRNHPINLKLSPHLCSIVAKYA